MNLVLYDGYCALCNRVVLFLVRIDRKNVLTFAPLQGETARGMLKASDTQLDTIVFLPNSTGSRQRKLTRSDAAIEILATVGGFWNVGGKLLALVPRRIRDAAYDWVSTNRNKWFERYETCSLPASSGEQRFLP